MSDFQVGDKVRILINSNSNPFWDCSEFPEGTITCVDDPDEEGLQIEVSFDAPIYPHSQWLPTYAIKKI